jgi:hypothetical protein
LDQSFSVGSSLDQATPSSIAASTQPASIVCPVALTEYIVGPAALGESLLVAAQVAASIKAGTATIQKFHQVKVASGRIDKAGSDAAAARAKAAAEKNFFLSCFGCHSSGREEGHQRCGGRLACSFLQE